MSQLIRWILINLVALIVISAPYSYALNGVRLLNLSDSKRTALFNVGSMDEIKEGDFGVIVKQVRDITAKDLRILPVAKLRNVKVTPNRSIWIVFKFYDPELLVKGEPYQLMSESQALSGRVSPDTGRTTVVADRSKASEAAKATLSNDKDGIAKLKDKYPETAPLHGKEVRSDKTIDLIDVDQWTKVKNEKYRTALYKSPYQDDFQRELRIATFEKIVASYLKRVNDPGFNYDTFYDQQKKNAFVQEFRERSNFSTEYESFVNQQREKARENAKLYRSILEKGDSWSEDFSSEEIRTVLSEVSILQERDRRKEVMSEPLPYTVFFNYGFHLNDTQTKNDVNFRRDSRYSVDFDFEGVPFLKHETLERFTLNASVRSNKTATEQNRLNASIDEVSGTVGVNWYPVYAPYVIEAPLIFVGTFIRSGTAFVEAPTNNEKATYTVLGAPGIRGGMKYNFKNNFGLRVLLSFESLKFDRAKQSKFNGVLEDQISLSEGKLGFGLAYSF